MTKINIITYPDIIYNECINLLLINPSSDLLENIQEEVLSVISNDMNIYLYDQQKYDENYFKWMLNVFNLSDITIVDIDNCSSDNKLIISYLIGKPKTYWLTNSQQSMYNIISSNRIYNLSILQKIGGYIEEI